MDRRVFVLFCLLTAVRSGDSADEPEIKFENENLKCVDGAFDKNPMSLKEDGFDTYTCTWNKTEGCLESETCAKKKVTVKILSSENLIQLDMKQMIGVFVSNVIVTILIGWAVYGICAQPTTRGGYQRNKASDRQALISNHNTPGADTYQPLNTRADEYSTLHAQRKNKSKQSV